MMSMRTGRPWMAVALLLGVSLALFTTGCYPVIRAPEPPPTMENGQRTDTLAVNDAEETQAVMALETARANYLNQLELMQGFYTSDLAKRKWAKNEWNNLNNSRTWNWEGIGPIPQPATVDMTNQTENSLAETLEADRIAYNKAVKNIVALYQARGGASAHKAMMVRNMQNRFEAVYIYPYIPEVQLPPLTLRATEEIPAAEALYQEGTALFWGGKYAPALANYEKERQALQKFQQLVQDYPTSRRIAMSAYYIADIYKEYWKEWAICVHWYERAWTWDPSVEEPACFQAGTVYDIHLKDYAKAVECFRKSLSRPDPDRPGNRSYAQWRIDVLAGK